MTKAGETAPALGKTGIAQGEGLGKTLLELAAGVEALTGLCKERRIIDRLDRTGDCWLWTGALDSRGRGRVWYVDKLELHHRAVWKILVGPIPDDALLCHHCDNPQCGNPSHLYVGDGKTNAADMFDRGRAWQQREPERARAVGIVNGKRNDWARGAANPKAKLSLQQVEQIRTLSGSSYDVAVRFGVNASTIQRIRKGAAWTC